MNFVYLVIACIFGIGFFVLVASVEVLIGEMRKQSKAAREVLAELRLQTKLLSQISEQQTARLSSEEYESLIDALKEDLPEVIKGGLTAVDREAVK
jgi:hypothetical protein